MKTRLCGVLAVVVLAVSFSTVTKCLGEKHTVSLSAKGEGPFLFPRPQTPQATYNVTTNQIVRLTSLASGSSATNLPFVLLTHSSGVSVRATDVPFTGLTNIALFAYYSGFVSNVISFWSNHPCLVTLEIETPVTTSYVPANAVLIPSDATGPVQILLESSSDLVNWTGALPGTYGASHSNRFFRVRALANP